MATTTQETGRHLALVDIRVPDNVRELDSEHVKALAGSIQLQGMLVPVVVRNDDEGFELVAGFHRVAAARSLELDVVPVVVRDALTEDACRREHHAQSAKPLRGSQGGQGDAQPRLDRGRRGAGARLAQEPRHRADQDPRTARARAAADRRRRHPPVRHRPAPRDRQRRQAVDEGAGDRAEDASQHGRGGAAERGEQYRRATGQGRQPTKPRT